MVVIDSYLPTDATTLIVMQAYPLDRSIVYHSFTQDQASDQKLTSIDFCMSMTQGSVGTFQMEVYAHTGTYGTSSAPTGDALATSGVITEATVNASATRAIGSPAVAAMVPFTFTGANQITLTAGAQYVLAIKCLTLTGTAVAYVKTSGTHDGNAGTWTSE